MIWGPTHFKALERFVESRRAKKNLNSRIDCSDTFSKSLDEWLKKQGTSVEEALSGFNPEQPPPLFRTICDCDLKDEHRKLQRQKLSSQPIDFIELADTTTEEDPGDTVPNPDRAKRLAAIEFCLREANPITKQCFLMTYLENRTASEIAQELGLRNEGNVYNRLSRLKQRIREHYKKLLDQEDNA